MCGCTGEGVAPRFAHYPCPYGIAFNVAHRFEKVAVVQGAGVKAILPEVAAALMQAVDILGVDEVRAADRLGQCLIVMRRQNQVDMIGHQAVARYLRPVSGGLSLQNLKIDFSVFLYKKDILPVVPPLGHMMSES